MFLNRTSTAITNRKGDNAFSVFVASLVRMQHSLYRKEIANWLVAREAALNLVMPRRYDLVQFYRDIETDLFIKGQVNQRINRIKNRKIKVVSKSTGKINEEKTKLLQNKKWFREFLRFSMEAKFHGYSVIYFEVDRKGRPVTKCVYREHVVPEQSLILKNPFDTTGLRFDEPPFIDSVIPVGDPESLGMYEQLAQAYVLRKHSWASWDEFEELFGVPLRWINSDTTDKKVLDELASFAETMGASNWAVVPGTAKMEIKEGRTQDAFQVFNEKRKAVNEEVALMINGNIETSTQTGSRAKAETVIYKTQDEITEDDKSDMLSVINDDLLGVLNNLFNYPFGDDDECQWDDTKQLEPVEKAKVYKAVSDMGFELDEEEVATSLSVKIIGRKQKNDPVPPKAKASQSKLNAYEQYMNMHTQILSMYHHLETAEA